MAYRTAGYLLTLVFLSTLWAMPSFSLAPLSSPKQLHVVLFTPRNDAFWTLFADITQAASKDLNIELEWLPAMNSPEKHLHNATEVLQRTHHRPDAIIYKNYDHTAIPILKMAEKAGVYSIIFEDGLSSEEMAKYGRPREKFKYWLGEFTPDQLETGYDLAQELIHQAKKQHSQDAQGHIQMLVLGGNMEETSSSERIRGLQIALQQHPDVVVNDILAGFWKEDVAYEKVHRTLQAYPDTKVIWTANDTMPVGARKAVNDLKYTDVIIGGTGTTPPGAMDLLKKQVQVSVGGHFIMGGLILVLLRDYFSGYDFARESTIMRLGLYTFTPENVGAYAQALKDNEWDKINFNVFSKAANPNLLKYNFGFQPILEQLKTQTD